MSKTVSVKENILNLAMLIDDKKILIKHQTNQLNIIKEEVRELMKDLGEKYLENEMIDVEMRISNSFDAGILGLEYPKFYRQYVTTKKVIIETEEMIIDKKGLEKDHPEAYKACLVELTPRLYIKRRQSR